MTTAIAQKVKRPVRSAGQRQPRGTSAGIWPLLYAICWIGVLVLGSRAAARWTRLLADPAESGWKPGLVDCGLFAAAVMLVVALAAWLRRTGLRRVCFGHVLAAMLIGTTGAAMRFVAGFYVPHWPQRDLRPILLLNPEQYNSWGLRDAERTVAKPPGVERILFIGDSFLEGGGCKAPLPLMCEERLRRQNADVECVNLGISATGPEHYYFRLQRVGEKLEPDAVLLLLYSGNDFVSPGASYHPARELAFTRLIAEAPRPSLLGQLLPEVNWLLVNRLRLSEYASGITPIEDEDATLRAIAALPRDEAVDRLSEHLHEHYQPDVAVEKIREILSRGGDELWSVFRPDHEPPETLMGWWASGLLAWELMEGDYAHGPDDVQQEQVVPFAAATCSWALAFVRRCREQGIPCRVLLAPVGAVDPEFAAYYKPFPRYYSFNYYCEARHAALRKQLEREGIDVIDLRSVLQGVPNTYRKSDAHWNEKGHAVVADYIARRLGSRPQ